MRFIDGDRTVYYTLAAPGGGGSLYYGFNWSKWQNLTLSKDSNKSHQITDVNILCKGNEPPSLFNICKIAYLTKVMQGKINEEYLPCLFNVSKTKVPSHLNLNSITMKHLKPYIEP